MLPEFIELEVVTPERHVLHENVQSLEMPGKEGYLGILPGHAPLLTELGIGVLTYQKGREIHALTVIQGYAEVLPDRVIILAELSERAEEIDVSRAQIAVERAQAELTRVGTQHDEWERVSQALERAKVRVQAAGKPPSQSGR
ncbi:MAG: F0F1 ATP synthase subunit epsilon [Candidatus Acidiferrales bacterium]